jgi:hypothetical protein
MKRGQHTFFGFRETNVKKKKQPPAKRKIPTGCACGQGCRYQGEVTGYGATLEVFCDRKARRVYVGETIGGCIDFAQRAA